MAKLPEPATHRKTKRKAFSVTLPDTLFVELERAEKDSGLPKSIVVQLALKDYFEALKEKRALEAKVA
jgi:hypothetical protein